MPLLSLPKLDLSATTAIPSVTTMLLSQENDALDWHAPAAKVEPWQPIASALDAPPSPRRLALAERCVNPATWKRLVHASSESLACLVGDDVAQGWAEDSLHALEAEDFLARYAEEVAKVYDFETLQVLERLQGDAMGQLLDAAAISAARAVTQGTLADLKPKDCAMMRALFHAADSAPAAPPCMQRLPQARRCVVYLLPQLEADRQEAAAVGLATDLSIADLHRLEAFFGTQLGSQMAAVQGSLDRWANDACSFAEIKDLLRQCFSTRVTARWAHLAKDYGPSSSDKDDDLSRALKDLQEQLAFLSEQCKLQD